MLKNILLICTILFLSTPSSCLDFGLWTVDQKAFHLLSLKTNVYVEESYARIEYVHEYENQYDSVIEAKYLFPRTESSVFYKFDATFDEKIVTTEIINQEEAIKSYQEARSQGQIPQISAIDQSDTKVMRILIGKFESKKRCTVKFSILQSLDIVLNQFWGFGVLSSLVQGYSNQNFDSSDSPVYQLANLQGSFVNQWDLHIEVSSNYSFQRIVNPSHSLEAQTVQRNGLYYASYDTKINLQEDFTFYYRTENVFNPGTVKARYPKYQNDYLLYLDFFPQLNSMKIETAVEIIKTRKTIYEINQATFNEDLKYAKGEFVFIIDRSGSMRRENRIGNLRNALRLFLRKLPQDSYFNIINFGSDYQFYADESLKSNEKNLNAAIDWTYTISANYGGTNILDPVIAITEIALIPNYPRIVIFLTDGDVENPDQVISRVYDYRDRMRFCSVGIGSGISNYLIESVGKAGGCTSEFVSDNQDVGNKTIHILQSAISQNIENATLQTTCYDEKNTVIHKEETSTRYILKNEKFSRFVYLSSVKNLNKCDCQLKYFNNFNSKTYQKNITVTQFSSSQVTETWHAVGYNKKIQDLTFESKSTETTKKKTEFTEIKKEVVNYSTKYQVLSEYTAIVSVEQVKKTETTNQETKTPEEENQEAGGNEETPANDNTNTNTNTNENNNENTEATTGNGNNNNNQQETNTGNQNTGTSTQQNMQSVAIVESIIYNQGDVIPPKPVIEAPKPTQNTTNTTPQNTTNTTPQNSTINNTTDDTIGILSQAPKDQTGKNKGYQANFTPILVVPYIVTLIISFLMF